MNLNYLKGCFDPEAPRISSRHGHTKLSDVCLYPQAGGGFFAGVCRLVDRPAAFRNPPPGHLRTVPHRCHHTPNT
jgi:hypothetical protein